MRGFLTCAGTAACLAAGLLAGTAAAAPGTFYVATNGSDAWSGTLAAPDKAKKDGPFATLERARAAAREVKGAVTVQVREGRYCLHEPLTFGAEDSGTPERPVLYRAYPGEHPILCGALPVAEFRPWKGEILQADLAPLGLKGARFRQLFFDGRRQIRARTPNFDANNPITGGWAFTDVRPDASVAAAGGGAKRVFRIKAADLRPWADPTQGEVCIYPQHEWWNNIVPIAAFDRDRRVGQALPEDPGRARPGEQGEAIVGARAQH